MINYARKLERAIAEEKSRHEETKELLRARNELLEKNRALLQLADFAIEVAKKELLELQELREWKSGQKGIEDYYIVVEKCDAWRKCSEMLADRLKLTSCDVASDQQAIAEFEKLKGNQ